jgi:hypothetical protein
MKLSKADERLRSESPAYRPEDDWDELEPQSMQVVLSVRFDPRSARRLRRLAQASGESASGLVRDWALARLKQAGADEVRAASAPGVREAAGSYRAEGPDLERVRERYRPETIDLLLVGESRPAGGTFFYLANSNLFYATHQAFQVAVGSVPPGAEFLDYLKDRGVWLYDISAEPVDRMRGRPRRSAVQARTRELVDVLRHAQPRRVVAIKKDLGPTVKQALADAGLSSERLTVLPFPLYQWRADYVRGLAQLIRPS